MLSLTIWKGSGCYVLGRFTRRRCKGSGLTRLNTRHIPLGHLVWYLEKTLLGHLKMNIRFLFSIHNAKQIDIICCKLMERIFLSHIACDNVQFFSRLSGCFYFINKVLFKRARKLWSLINLLTFYSSFFILIFSRRHRIINMRKHF